VLLAKCFFDRLIHSCLGEEPYIGKCRLCHQRRS